MTTSRSTLLGGAVLVTALGLTVAAQTGPAVRPSAAPGAAAAAARPAARSATAPKPVAAHGAEPTLTAVNQTELVATYCATCHSERAKAGGLSLANWNSMRAQEQPQVAEKIIRKLRAGMMPPAGAKRPDEASLAALTNALESRMDEHAAINPNPGWRPFQRLNRAEYAARRQGPARHRRRRRGLPAARHHQRTASTTSPTRRASRRR